MPRRTRSTTLAFSLMLLLVGAAATPSQAKTTGRAAVNGRSVRLGRFARHLPQFMQARIGYKQLLRQHPELASKGKEQHTLSSHYVGRGRAGSAYASALIATERRMAVVNKAIAHDIKLPRATLLWVGKQMSQYWSGLLEHGHHAEATQISGQMKALNAALSSSR